jgi:hypothetical protein
MDYFEILKKDENSKARNGIIHTAPDAALNEALVAAIVYAHAVKFQDICSVVVYPLSTH